MIPFDRLDNPKILESIDLTYYLRECRRILKTIHDKEYVDKHKIYQELRQYIQRD